MIIIRPKPTLSYPLKDSQTIFDYIWYHFVVEQNPLGAIEGTASCRYDTPSGGCAIGCLLKEEDRKKVGNASFSVGLAFLNVAQTNSSGEESIVVRAFDPSANRVLLEDLQKAHDQSVQDVNNTETDLQVFKRRLANLGNAYNLTIPTQDDNSSQTNVSLSVV